MQTSVEKILRPGREHPLRRSGTDQEVNAVTAPGGLGLARVTVVAPKRRIDVALPDSALVGELLPHLLRHAGEDLPSAEDEQADWTLRRTTGAELEVTRNLAAQGVRDGELLQLVPRQMDWPELAYDDATIGALREAHVVA